MAKWFGKIGFAMTSETEPGIWEAIIVEKDYCGDRISNRLRRQQSGAVFDDVVLANTLSILVDAFAIDNCSSIVYAEIMGMKWKITEVDIQPPRMILTVGGVYNGQSN